PRAARAPADPARPAPVWRARARPCVWSFEVGERAPFATAQPLLHVGGELVIRLGNRELLHGVMCFGVGGEGLADLLGATEPPAEGKVLSQRIAFGVRLPHQDPPQIGMPPERDPEH